MPQFLDAACDAVSADTRSHDHRTARNIAEQREHLAARDLLAPDHAIRCRLGEQVEAMLAQVDSDQRDGVHDDLPKTKQPDQRNPIGLFRSG
jgi:hypothetical protein